MYGPMLRVAGGKKRNLHGFAQYKPDGQRRWQFCIVAFGGKPLPDGSDSIGHVQLFAGGTAECQMDMRGRVKVNGRWYGRPSWNH